MKNKILKRKFPSFIAALSIVITSSIITTSCSALSNNNSTNNDVTTPSTPDTKPTEPSNPTEPPKPTDPSKPTKPINPTPTPNPEPNPNPNPNPIQPEPEQPEPGVPINPSDSLIDKSFASNDLLTSIGILKIDDIATKKRNVQTEYYNSEVWNKYHNSHGFVYPSQKRNYKLKDVNSEGNNFFGKGSNKIDGFDLVFNERVTNNDGSYVEISGKKIKYNDEKWIKQEIENGTLKKHRATDDMYKNDISNIDSITKKYTISNYGMPGIIPLGLYAPAGEVIEISFDNQSWEFVKNNISNFEFIINDNLWDNYPSNNTGKMSNRYPFVRTYFGLNESNKTLKIGSPFGGGISFNLKKSTDNSNLTSPFRNQNIVFTVRNAVPCLFYQDGITTQKEWDDQIELLKSQKLAPIFQGISNYFAFTIPFTDLNEIGHLSLDNVIYPKDSFKRWNQYLYLSNYFAGNDTIDIQHGKRIHMLFGDDMWNSNLAYGGDNKLYCKTEWGSRAFISKDWYDSFNANTSWGFFHEINHNFEQNQAFFSKRSHGATNVVTAFNLSVLSDVTRFRNEVNWTGENVNANTNISWPYLDTPYSIIKNLLTKAENSVNEYPIYSLLLFLMGSKNFVEYVRDDIINHKNTEYGWTALKEIERISETLQLNLWPAFEIYRKWWHDNWPVNYDSATTEEKAIIDKLKKYKAVDFIANQYASGSYLYNQKTNSYDYTGDTLPAFEIPGLEQYTFDFDKMITSTNTNFNWTLKTPESSTKLGGSLEVDPNNPKKVIYIPNNQKVSEIDEFDVSIIPGNWTNKPDNYVPEYRFKIKVRQVINRPTLELFDFSSSSQTNDVLLTELKSNQSPFVKMPISNFDNIGYKGVINSEFKSKKIGARIKYKFVAPKDGNYTFKSKYSDNYAFYANNVKANITSNDSFGFLRIYNKSMKKGEVLEIENLLVKKILTNDEIYFGQEIYLDDQKIDLFNNSLISNLTNQINQTFPEIIADPKYLYKPREVDNTMFNKSLSSLFNFSDYDFNTSSFLSPEIDYNLTSTTTNRIDALNDYDSEVEFFIDNYDYNDKFKNPILDFDINFTKSTNVKSLIFGNYSSNSKVNKPSKIKIIGYSDNNSNEQILYDGIYDSVNRDNQTTAINLTKSGNFKKIKVQMFNTMNGMKLSWIRPSVQEYLYLGPTFGINNSHIIADEKWKYHKNDASNLSAINNIYLKTTQKNSVIEFTLNNAEGFSLVGQSGNNLSNFDLYINDQLVETVTPNSNNTIYNASLFNYHSNNNSILKVKIVTKEDKPFYLNYIMTFGQNAYLS